MSEVPPHSRLSGDLFRSFLKQATFASAQQPLLPRYSRSRDLVGTWPTGVPHSQENTLP